MFIQYLSPGSPHYRRFGPVQERILSSWGSSRAYLLQRLVAQNMGDPALRHLHNDAITLSNILRFKQHELARRLLQKKRASGILTARLRVALFNEQTYPADKFEIREGDVWEVAGMLPSVMI